MKKSILAAVMAMCSIAAYAQPAIGIQLGANFGMGQSGGSYFGSGLSNDPKVGLLVGLLADIPVIKKLSFRPELNFIQKGSKFGGAGYLGGPSNSTKVTLNYIELPLNVVYKMSFGSSSNKLYFGLGPSIGVGLAGTSKNSAGKADIKFNGDPNQLKRLDVGLNVLAGYQLVSGFFGKVGYTLGFANLDPDANQSYKNRGVSICVGYMLGGTKKK